MIYLVMSMRESCVEYWNHVFCEITYCGLLFQITWINTVTVTMLWSRRKLKKEFWKKKEQLRRFCGETEFRLIKKVLNSKRNSDINHYNYFPKPSFQERATLITYRRSRLWSRRIGHQEAVKKEGPDSFPKCVNWNILLSWLEWNWHSKYTLNRW